MLIAIVYMFYSSKKLDPSHWVCYYLTEAIPGGNLEWVYHGISQVLTNVSAMTFFNSSFKKKSKAVAICTTCSKMNSPSWLCAMWNGIFRGFFYHALCAKLLDSIFKSVSASYFAGSVCEPNYVVAIFTVDAINVQRTFKKLRMRESFHMPLSIHLIIPFFETNNRICMSPF